MKVVAVSDPAVPQSGLDSAAVLAESATGRQWRWWLRGLGLVNAVILTVTVWSRREILSVEIARHQPPVDPGYVGLAQITGLLVMLVGAGVVLLMLSGIARFVDRTIAQAWAGDSGGRGAVVARAAVGLTLLTCLAADLVWGDPSDHIGEALPYLAAIPIAVVAGFARPRSMDTGLGQSQSGLAGDLLGVLSRNAVGARALTNLVQRVGSADGGADPGDLGARRRSPALIPAWLAVVGLISDAGWGVLHWTDLAPGGSPQPEAITVLLQLVVVASAVVGVVALPFLLAPGVLPWVLPGVLVVGGMVSMLGSRALAGTSWGWYMTVVAVMCPVGALVSLFVTLRGRTVRRGR